MICTRCGRNSKNWSNNTCPSCGYALPRGQKGGVSSAPRPSSAQIRRKIARGLIWAVGGLLSAALFSLLFYRLHYWVREFQISQLYATGRETPYVLDQVILDDGRPGHALTLYGRDGDIIDIKELDQSFMVVGGVTRVEMPDSEWFDLKPEGVESAEITLVPVRTSEDGARFMMPPVSFEVETPSSPLTVIEPKQDGLEVYASAYPLTLNVVPGSRVLIDGRDYTDFVDQQGNLTATVPVFARGENVVSVVVETAHHKQTRQDVVLYRKALEIDLELSANTVYTSERNTMTIQGKLDPAATLVIDSSHVEENTKIQEDGSFSFVAQFDVVGMNTVKFRATMEGKRDSVISFQVKHVPNFHDYTRKAWKLGAVEYDETVKLTSMRIGQIYLCKGTAVEILSYDPQVFILNVGTDAEPQYVMLENQSSVGTPTIGVKYDAYADLTGTDIYGVTRIPEMTARYMKRTDGEWE